MRGQGQASLCSLLTYLQTELPAQLVTATGDCSQLERDRTARLDKINSLLEVRGRMAAEEWCVVARVNMQFSISLAQK